DVVCLREIQTGAERHPFKHQELVMALAFHPDGKRLATADTEGTIKLWDVRNGRELRTYRGHGNVITGIAFSPDGRWFATSCRDHTVRIWDATMTPREWFGQEAHEIVQSRFEKVFSRDEVLASLEADSNLDDAVRQVARELAQEWEEDPSMIGSL